MNFKEFIAEKLKTQQIDNWHGLLEKDEYLSIAVELLGHIEALGGEALIVGGAVRDLLIGKIPHDVDIATNVDLDKIEDKFSAYDLGKSKTFGVIGVKYKGHIFEIAHYRTEEGYTDNRRPDVVKNTKSFEEDSARRDLTFNALGLNKDGVIIDYHDGTRLLKL